MDSTIITNYSIVAAVKDQASCDLSGEAVVLNFKDGIYYGLDSVGALVWDLIKEPKTVKEINSSVTEEFDVELSGCEGDIINLLKELADKGLIEIKNEKSV